MQTSHLIWKLLIGFTPSTPADFPILQSKHSMLNGSARIHIGSSRTSGKLDWEYQVAAGMKTRYNRPLKAVQCIICCCVTLSHSFSVKWPQFKCTTWKTITTRSTSLQISTTMGLIYYKQCISARDHAFQGQHQ